MCGIAGFFGERELSPQIKDIKDCISLMKLRGPDHQSYKSFDVLNKKLVLINSRLKILDKSSLANQPMTSDKGILVFNGLIYNYLEIKENLKKLGVKFKTTSDTEVLLKILDLKGVEGLKELDGMWSLIYYNYKSKKMIVARDPFGEKPLYYMKKENFICFGSSPNYILKLLSKKKKLNYNKISNFLIYGPRLINNDHKTFFSDIKFFKNNSFFEINKNLEIKNGSYWSPNKIKIKKNNKSFKENSEELKSIINKTFQKRTRSDYNLSVLLSGGIDTSIVSSITKKNSNKDLKFYSIKSTHKSYDETKNIKLNIKNLKCNHEFVEPSKISFYALQKLIENTSTIYPTITWLLYRNIINKIKRDKIKTVIQGNGGDELFGGYYTHYLSYLYSIKNSNFFKDEYSSWKKKLKPFIRSKNLNDFDLFSKNQKKGINPNFHKTELLQKFFNIKTNNKFFKKKIFFKDLLKDILYKDLFYYSLPIQLTFSDNISMSFGVENRSPFLSKELYEFSFKLQNKFLIHDGFTKYILRETFKSIIPKEIATDKEKVGFFGNINDVVDLKDPKYKEIVFDNSFLKKIISEKDVQKIFNKKEFLDNHESHLLFSLINTGIFLNSFQ